MNKGMILFTSGLILTLGAVGGIENLAPDATISDWIVLVGVSALGLLSMYAATLTFKGE